MRKLNRSALSIVTAAIIGATAIESSAATIAFQGFEANATDTWAYATSGTGGAVGGAGAAVEYPAGASRVNSGSASYQTSDGTSTVSFNALDVSSFTDKIVGLRLAAISTGPSNGLDAGDRVKVYVALNGADFSPTPDLTIGGFSNARWLYSASGEASTSAGTAATFAPSAGGVRTTDGYSTLLVSLPDSVQSLSMKIVSNNDNVGEIWSVDDVTVTGTAVPEPASLGLLAGGAAMLLRRRGRQG
ncbi:MAG TPA: PEP-CTERM sorting domain-containing protein [Tepidisphaeraceae bacterium]|jgi:hypothetical protein|nr:PEP-CTERM sorting domain-containing protein [Tepidisphaeraceae bacterium]